MFGHQMCSSSAAGIEALGQKGWCANNCATKLFLQLLWRAFQSLKEFWMEYPYKLQFCLKGLGRQGCDRYLSIPQNNGQYGIYSYCLNQVTFRRDAYVLKVWLDGLCTEGGQQQPSPTIKLVCPDSSVRKVVCSITRYIPLSREFELHYR